jgi:hypothetical protein
MQNLSAFGNVLIAADWWGMASEDVAAITRVLATDFEDFGIIPDRLHQGLLNALVLMRIVGSEDFQTHPSMQLGGRRVLTPKAPRTYNGNSDGGILGTVYMAISTEVTRGVLGVAGMPYSLMLPRSVDFAPFFTLLKVRFPNPIDLSNVFSLIQLLWDYCEPAGYAASLHPESQPLPGTPSKEIMIHFSVGDAQVPNVATLNLARTIGAFTFAHEALVGPTVPAANWSLYGLKPRPSPTKAPLMVGWAYPDVVVPIDNVPANGKTDTHEYTRQQPDAQEMIDGFLKTGSIVNTCGGECHGFATR